LWSRGYQADKGSPAKRNLAWNLIHTALFVKVFLLIGLMMYKFPGFYPR
jgi:hypothetical protein